ncbi:MAG: trypsin-like peptidase domain-containing protein, partial [Chitinophagaceae bacterium]
MKLKQILAIVGISATTAVASVWGFGKMVQNRFTGTQEVGKIPANYAGYFGKSNVPISMDFTAAASSATPAVVHIKTKTKAKQITNNLPRQRNPFSDMFGGDMFEEFFNGPRMSIIPEQKASGSGVIISDDGYIITNNHVVSGADEITVTLTNKKTYKATVIGTDANTDLAVIKVEASGLPYLIYGNSDDAKLGQWVLAIGYPLNLDVTVTAGIVSAKARNIGIINPNNNSEAKNPVESFIQTDAAVNPGNSGGALINLNGEVIGINSAIASQNGSYIGYSYAIPINLAKKVVNDIIKYGTVQRAYLGLTYASDAISEEQKKQEGIKDGEGVYVTDVLEGGAAAAAGIKKGDFVKKINGTAVLTAPEMVEQIARYKPGDKISITYSRDGKETTANVTLKNKLNTTSVVKGSSTMDKLGAEFATVDKKVAQANEIAGGVVIKKISGGALKNSRIQEGFVVTSVNGQEVKTLEDFTTLMKSAKGTIYLDGIYPGFSESYRYPVKLDD